MGCQPPSYQIVGRNLTTTFGRTRVSRWAWTRGCPAFFTPKQMDRERTNRKLEEMLRDYVSL